MDELWTIERALWLEGAARFRAAMAAECIMVFPAPVGILRGGAILESLEQAQRWRRLEIEDAVSARPAANLAVLAYRATARRDAGPSYRTYCSSTYVREGGRWLIIQHQHTPL